MTTTLATDSKNDIFLGTDGNISVLRGLPATEGACATASRVRLSEEVLAKGAGLPMFEAIWNGTPNVPLYLSFLENTLNGVDGVNQVGQITTTLGSGIFKYKASIETNEGSGTATATVNQ